MRVKVASKAAAAILLMTMLAGIASAAITTKLGPSSVTLSTVIPAKLVAGTTGTTTLGVNATSAVTVFNAGTSLTTLASLVSAKSQSSSGQTVTLVLGSVTGLANLRTLTLTVGGVAEIAISNGVITQSSGSAVTLPAGGSLLVAGTVRFTSGGTGIASVPVSIVVHPAGQPGTTLVESYTLSLI